MPFVPARRRRRLVSALIGAALVPAALTGLASGALAAPGGSHGHEPKGKALGQQTVDVQILNVSDFHGQLDPLSVFGVGDVGGAAALSTYFAADRAANPNTLLLTAGDAVGASPPLSSFFADAPTIDVMNYLGFDADTFGNHNFDAGLGRLQSQIDTADFSYLSANLANVDDNLEGVAPYKIFTVGGVKVAVIGVTNPEAPTLVTPGNLGSLTLTDPVAAANRARKAAKKGGAKAFVAIGHLGIEGTDAAGAPAGPLVDFARGVTGFDLILGDHTNVQYKATINGALVLENLSKGASYARTTLSIKASNGKVRGISSQFVQPLASAVPPDPRIAEILAPYRSQLSAKLDVPIGTATGVLPRSGNNERLGEAAIGDLTTDALRATYGTQIAFTNGGGLRSALPSSYTPADKSLRRTTSGYAAGPPYDLVLGDAYSLLPFGNEALTRTVTGSQLRSALELSVGSLPNSFGGFLQISGFTFTFDANRPAGSRVVSVTLDDGRAIPNSSSFSVTAATNDFTNAGGDGYTMFADGQGTSRDLLATVVGDYIAAQGTISPALDGRITRVG